MKKISLSAFTLLLLFNLSSCKNEDVFSINDSSSNIPVIANAANAFSFTVAANRYNYSETHNLQMSADTLSVAITISGEVNGNGNILIKDGTGAAIYQKDLGSSMISAEVLKLVTIPKTLNLNFSNFTGKIIIAVAGK
ncbi:MAG: hypothetical protein M1480_11145 [Bacteroidetes bacterium]|nr:hypothetical protein [Bacteroidota bacterium]